jgi:hypothetical protein
MAKPVSIAPTALRGPWTCVLCGAVVVGPGLHYCAAEARIREIIREELRAAQPLEPPR